MRVQITLTPSEAKRVIAKAVALLPEVVEAREKGLVLLKGGTTVSAVAEELFGVPLRLSGRVSGRGTLAAAEANPEEPHSVLARGGVLENIDGDFAAAAGKLGRGDVIVIGANAIDGAGNAAMMAGSVGGGPPGPGWSALTSEGTSVIIAAGLEKLIPGTIRDAMMAAGRKGVDKSIGMAVGLLPLTGRLVTEKEALEILADVRASVIGAGGVFGGEGSTVLVAEGEPAEAEKIFALALEIKGASASSFPDSLPECAGPNPRCVSHLGCIYKAGYAGKRSGK